VEVVTDRQIHDRDYWHDLAPQHPLGVGPVQARIMGGYNGQVLIQLTRDVRVDVGVTPAGMGQAPE